MPAVAPQKFLNFLSLKSSEIKWHLDRVDYQNDFNRRIGLGRGSIECVKGKDFLRLAIVQYGEVVVSQAGDMLFCAIGHHDVKVDEALNRVCSRRGMLCKRWRL